MTDKEVHTDIILNDKNMPFITLTESKVPNTWYHNKSNNLFSLTSKGFRRIKKGNKKVLIRKELL